MLAGGAVADRRTPLLLLAMTLFYVGGMYLNDAFDREHDARHRPERPIPSGEASARTVFAAGFAMLAAGVVLLAWIGFGFADGAGWPPVAAGVALTAAIVHYDRRHKGNPIGPFWMGVCRMLVYVAAGLALTGATPGVLLTAALLLLSYLIGLTYVAKQESLGQVRNLWPLLFLGAPIVHGAAALPGTTAILPFFLLFAGWTLFALSFLVRRRPGDVPRAVVALIAGISLLDALFIAGQGAANVALFAVAGFALTLAMQRLVPGT